MGRDEGWIVQLFEPIRLAYFTPPNGPPLPFVIRQREYDQVYLYLFVKKCIKKQKHKKNEKNLCKYDKYI